MANSHAVVSVTTTATPLHAADADGSSMCFYNDGAATVYLGSATVTTSGATKGAPVPAGTWSPAFDLSANERWYGIVASGTVSVIVLLTGVG